MGGGEETGSNSDAVLLINVLIRTVAKGNG